MSIVRVESPLSGSELLLRLNAIGQGRRTFARHSGVSVEQLRKYVSGKLPVPSFIHRLLLFDETLHALGLLTHGDKQIKVGKQKIQSIIIAANAPITVLPLKRKRKGEKRSKRNLLSPKYIPRLLATQEGGDPLIPKPLWQQLAEQVQRSPNHDAVARALLLRRPNPPRSGPDDDTPTPTRTTGPI